MHLRRMYSAALGWNVLYMFVKFTYSNTCFNSNISLFIFCLDDLSITDNGILKSPTIIILLSISPLRFVSICFIFQCLGVGNIFIYGLLYLLDVLTL